MFEARTNEWQETCLQGLCELAPDRRMAVLEKLRSILRKENHEFGPLWVDFAQSEVKRNGTPVSLTNLEFRLLRYLMERAGCLVSREELLRSVWEYNRQALTRTVDMHIHSLRQKLEADATRPELIITVKGAGYKFLARACDHWRCFDNGDVLIFIPVIMQVQKDKRIPPMFLHRLFSWLRRKRRGSTLPQDEPGIVISTRMKELVPIESANTVETPFTDPANEDDEIGENREKFGTWICTHLDSHSSTDVVHAAGGKIVIQFMHAGRIAHPANTPHGRQPVAPSAVQPKAKMFTATGLQDIREPRALKREEIAATVRDFRCGAAAPMEAGADGVETHGANGYLIQQFLSHNANRRTDNYAGSIEGPDSFRH